MESQYVKQANEFLKKASAEIKIDFVGLAINKEWKERRARNLYKITLTTEKGSMRFDFWDSIHNTEITQMTAEEYAKKRFNSLYSDLRFCEQQQAKRELKIKKAEAVPSAYDVLACLTKYDPGTFEDFCCDFGYDEDSRTAERIYFAVQKEYNELCRIFTAEQLEELQEIN